MSDDWKYDVMAETNGPAADANDITDAVFSVLEHPAADDSILERAATILPDAVAELKRDNDAANDLDVVLGDYIRREGVMALLHEVARVVESLCQFKGDDFEKAAQAIDECAEKCNLRYDNERDDAPLFGERPKRWYQK